MFELFDLIIIGTLARCEIECDRCGLRIPVFVNLETGKLDTEKTKYPVPYTYRVHQSVKYIVKWAQEPEETRQEKITVHWV